MGFFGGGGERLVLDSTSDADENSSSNTTNFTTSQNCRLFLPLGTYVVELFAWVGTSTGGTPASSSCKYKPSFTGTLTPSNSIPLVLAGFGTTQYGNPASLQLNQSGSRAWDFIDDARFSSNISQIDYRRFKATISVEGFMEMNFGPSAAVASQFAVLRNGTYIRALKI